MLHCVVAVHLGCILVLLFVELCINQEALSPHIVKMGEMNQNNCLHMYLLQASCQRGVLHQIRPPPPFPSMSTWNFVIGPRVTLFQLLQFELLRCEDM